MLYARYTELTANLLALGRVDADLSWYYGKTVPTLSFKVSAEEARLIRRKAREQKTTVSEYIRRSALRLKPSRGRKLVIKKHPVSGLPYDASSVDEPVITREEIASALDDFP